MLVYITPEQFAPSSLYEAFFTPDNIESTLLLFIFFELLYGCVGFVFFFFLSFFVVFYAKGREASDNLYTVYTAHPITTPPRPPTRTRLHRTRTWRLPLHFPKKKQKNPCSASRGSLWPDGGTKTLRNKINRKENVLLIGMYNLCNSFLNHIWFWHLLLKLQDQSIIHNSG